MPNPFAVLNPNNPMRGYDFSALQNMYRSGGNPMKMIQSMAMQDPRMQPVLQALQSGADPKQMFFSMCQQRGINPQEFLRNITGNNGF